jgi:hypothetical protein
MIACFSIIACSESVAQQYSSVRIPIGEPSSLTFAPDARSAAMGEAGVALSADANATYWNPAKLAVADREMGVSASYTPWLASLTDGSWLGYASAYFRMHPEDFGRKYRKLHCQWALNIGIRM